MEDNYVSIPKYSTEYRKFVASFYENISYPLKCSFCYSNDMHCPNCKQPMVTRHFDRQEILHCRKCGGNFFKKNSINKITELTASRLNNDRFSDFEYSGEKYCPVDQSILYVYTDKVVKKEGVHVLKCLTCEGIYASPQDLVNFKKKQTIIFEYFKITHTPLPSAVFALVLMALIVFSTVMTLNGNLKNINTTSTRANDIIKAVVAYKQDSTLFFVFTTSVPMQSAVILRNATTGKTQTYITNAQASMRHTLQINRFNFSDDIYYTIILTDTKGNTTQTSERKLIVE